MTLSTVVDRAKTGFDTQVLTDGGIMLAGGATNAVAHAVIAQKIGSQPGSMFSEYGGFATAFALLAVPKYGQKMFTGALAVELARVVGTKLRGA